VLIVRSYTSSIISQNAGYYFEHYDSNLKLINKYNFQKRHTSSQKYSVFLGVFTIVKEVKIIEMYYDINEKTYICLANSFNTSDFKLEIKELFRLTRDEIKEYGGFSLSETYYQNVNTKSLTNGSFGSQSDENPFFNFSFSGKSAMDSSSGGNSKMAMVVNKEKNAFSIAINFNNKNDSDMLKIYLFDSQLNKKFEQNFAKEIKGHKYIFQNIDLSEDGNSIYLLSKSFTKEMSNKEKGGKY
jgi:hypothetical protein